MVEVVLHGDTIGEYTSGLANVSRRGLSCSHYFQFMTHPMQALQIPSVTPR